MKSTAGASYLTV